MFLFFHVFFLPQRVFVFVLFVLSTWSVVLRLGFTCCGREAGLKAARPGGRLLQCFRQGLGRTEPEPGTGNVGTPPGSPLELGGNGKGGD